MKTIKKILASLGLYEDYWNTRLPIGSQFQPLEPGHLKGYFIDYSAKAHFKGPTKAGVPQVDFGGENGLQTYPIHLAQMALGYYEVWLKTNGSDMKGQFIQLADWFVSHQTHRPNGVGGWEAHINLPKIYALEPPWISAMGQGQAISVLLRAHQMVGNGRYLSAAQSAVKAFDYVIEEGGVKTVEKDGSVFYEEYPSRRYSHVLNGFIFSLWGLYDYFHYSRESSVKALFDKGVETLEKYLPRYDLGYWTRYDLYPARIKLISSFFYHQLHIDQLDIMHQITGKVFFQQMSDRWKRYRDNKLMKIRYLIDKVVLKLYNILVVHT
jgi:hypothetical protein